MQIARDEAREILEDLRLNAATAQQIEQQFAAARRLGGEQHAGLGLAAMWAASSAAGCSARGSMRTVAGATLAKFCTAPAVSGGHSKECSCTCSQAANCAAEFARRQVKLRGIENRPMTVVAQLFVPFHDAIP